LGICGFLLLISLLFIIGRVWDIVFALVGVSLIVPIGLLTIDYGLRYGGVEYWISKDEIVAHDRLFRTRLWRIEAWRPACRTWSAPRIAQYVDGRH
jgi:hypothetical protein